MLLPVPSDPKLKDPSTFKLIGKEGVVKRLDSAIKSNGTAEYTLDINEPDMLTRGDRAIAAVRRHGGFVRCDRGESDPGRRRRQTGSDRHRGLRQGLLAGQDRRGTP